MSNYTPMIEVYCVTSWGQEITIGNRMAGMATGYAIIDNPYWHGDEHWRRKDGDTVMEAQAGDYNAMPVADAYAAFHAMIENERVEYSWDAFVADEVEFEAVAPTAFDLIQDRLEAGKRGQLLPC